MRGSGHERTFRMKVVVDANIQAMKLLTERGIPAMAPRI
jgi:hypothetical protein